MNTSKKSMVGKWAFHFGIVPSFYRTNGFIFYFGIFKVIKLWPEAEEISKEYYKGFWIRKEFAVRGFELFWKQK